MTNTWFTSDTHFGHRNILKFEAEARPFSDTSHMDEVLIANWNAVVAPEDTVWHLGDAVMGDLAAGLEKMRRLNGRKMLVPGNHDRVFSGESTARRERFLPLYQEVFAEVTAEAVDIRLSNGQQVTLCHFPYEGDHTATARYEANRPEDLGNPLIHGHVHSMWHTRGRQLNVGVDVSNLTPVSEAEVISWTQTLDNA